jgi:hypothetical protein
MPSSKEGVAFKFAVAALIALVILQQFELFSLPLDTQNVKRQPPVPQSPTTPADQARHPIPHTI